MKAHRQMSSPDFEDKLNKAVAYYFANGVGIKQVCEVFPGLGYCAVDRAINKAIHEQGERSVQQPFTGEIFNEAPEKEPLREIKKREDFLYRNFKMNQNL